MMKTPFKFFAIEGPDGAGKTTIRDAIYQKLLIGGYTCFMIGQHSWLDPAVARTIIDFREQRVQHPAARIEDAYFEDKRLHGEHNIKPALTHSNVIADRYIFSDAVYHEALFNIPMMKTLNRHFSYGTLMPDAILFINVSGGQAFERVLARGKQQRFYEQEDWLSKISNLYQRLFLVNPPKWLPQVVEFSNSSIEWKSRVDNELYPKVIDILGKTSENGE